MSAVLSRFAVVAILLAIAGLADESLARFEPKLKTAVKLEPNSFEANYNLGELYLHAGRLRDGIPYMEKALRLRPSDYVSGYDLALAYFETRDYSKARQHIRTMLSRADSAELHSLLADVEEAAGDYVTAAGEYQRAAHIEPSEEHIFAWGSELLTHQTYQPATAVFARGAELYPRSAKLQAGLGIAFYLRGSYDEAVKALCSATDLDPSEAWPYLFLGRMYNTPSGKTDEVRKRLGRFAQLQPNNARGLYYYAMSLWTRDHESQAEVQEVESLLKQAITQDPAFADAHLQLGILLMDKRKSAEAVDQFQRAIALQPDLTPAHYHLAQAYARTGEKSRAEQELQAFQRSRSKEQAGEERGRKEIRQFVLDMKEQPAGAPVR